MCKVLITTSHFVVLFNYCFGSLYREKNDHLVVLID